MNIRKVTLITVLSILLAFSNTAHSQDRMEMVYFDNFPPFSWSEKDGTMRGVLVDVMNEIAGSKMGITLSHQGFPWARAQQMVKEGEADGFVTVPTLPRQEYTYTCKEEVIMSKMVIFVKKGSDKTKEIKRAQGISDLKELSMIDYVGNGWGEKNLKGFRRHLAPKTDNVFQMLAGNRGDLCITDSMVGRYTLKQLSLQDQIEEMPLVLEQVPFVLCVQKDSKYSDIIEEFDARLREARESGRLQEIYDKYR